MISYYYAAIVATIAVVAVLFYKMHRTSTDARVELETVRMQAVADVEIEAIRAGLVQKVVTRPVSNDLVNKTYQSVTLWVAKGPEALSNDMVWTTAKAEAARSKSEKETTK